MFCIGCIISVVNECKVTGITQAKIVTSFLRSIDPNCEELDNAAASNIARGVKNPSIYVRDAIAAYPEDSYNELAAYFQNNIVNLIKENARNHVRDVLVLMIQEDSEIEDDTVVEVVSGVRKTDLPEKIVDLATLLAGVFLYVLKNTTNKTGGKVKAFAKEYLERVNSGEKPIKKMSSNSPTEESAKLKQERPMVERPSSQSKLIDELIDQEAVAFCMNYEDERDYTALCQIVSLTNPIKKHHREMYNAFCLNTASVRDRILELNNVKKIHVSNNNWWGKYLSLFVNDYEKYGLGGDRYAYSFGQYFYMLLDYGDAPIGQYLQNIFPPQIEAPIMKSSPDFKYDLPGFVGEFMRLREQDVCKDKIEPPMNYLWRELDFACCDGLTLSACLALFIISTCRALPLNSDDKNICFVYSGPDIYALETAEDLFYMTLLTLYETYEKESA